ncbi:MAG: nuclear transport factor 2 family protein [Terriglobia bacterium]
MATRSGKGEGSRATSPRRGRLTASGAVRFLKLYKEAWETRNADLAASLFTRDAHYWENPFGPPIVGREAIRAYWVAATEKQKDIQFSVRDSFFQKFALAIDWRCLYTSLPSGEHRELAGIMIADFYGGQVRTFRECWLRRNV